MSKPFMVQQVIKYSDGTETIINYKEGNAVVEEAPKIVEEIIESPVVEESAPEVASEIAEESAEEVA